MNLLYLWVAERIKDEDWVRFEEELYRPIPGAKVTQRQIDDEWAAFNEAAGMFG